MPLWDLIAPLSPQSRELGDGQPRVNIPLPAHLPTANPLFSFPSHKSTRTLWQHRLGSGKPPPMHSEKRDCKLKPMFCARGQMAVTAESSHRVKLPRKIEPRAGTYRPRCETR